jgi:peroxiredoxin
LARPSSDKERLVVNVFLVLLALAALCLVFLLAVFFGLIFPIWLFVHCLRNENLGIAAKAAWCCAILFLWTLGAGLYGLFGSRQKRFYGTSAAALGLAVLFLFVKGPAAKWIASIPLPSLPSAGGLGTPALEPVSFAADYQWAVRSMDGLDVNMADARGKTVVLNLWATWCPPCRREMPSLQKLHDKVKDAGIVVMSVSEEDLATVQKFAKREGYTFPIYASSARAPSAYATDAIPATFVIAPDGNVVGKMVGAAAWDADEFVAYLKTLKDKKALSSSPTND